MPRAASDYISAKSSSMMKSPPAPSSSSLSHGLKPADHFGGVISFEEGWQMLEQDAIRAVQQNVERRQSVRFDKETFASLYSQVYSMCTQKAPHNWSGKLYFGYRKALEQYMESVVLPALERASADSESLPRNPAILLREVVRRWRDHKRSSKALRKVFGYLDRYYVRRLAIDSLEDVGVKAFKSIVFDPLKERIAAAFVTLMTRERVEGVAGAGVDRSMMKSVSGMFMAMGQGARTEYERCLEKTVLDAASKDSADAASTWSKEQPLADYLYRVEARLDEEASRCETYLPDFSKKRVLRVCEKELLTVPQKKVLTENLGKLMQEGDRRSLQRMYRLFSRVPGGLEGAARECGTFVNKFGADSVRSTKPQKLVEELLALNSRFTSIMEECFHGDATFKEATDSALEGVVNLRLEGLPALLSSHIDKLLRSTTKSPKPSPSTVRVSIQDCTALFAFLRDKDIFGEVYSKQLGKRLLLGRHAGEALEFKVLEGLRARCGAQFVTKMEGMIKDIALAKSCEGQFRTFLRDPQAVVRASRAGALAGKETLSPEKKPKLSQSISDGTAPKLQCNLSVMALTHGHWPTYKNIDGLKLPRTMLDAQAVFTDFYNIQTANRKLRWMYSLGTVVVEARYGGRSVDVTCSVLQASILCLFADLGAPSPAIIAQRLGVTEKEVCKQVLPLMAGKHRLLTVVGGVPLPSDAEQLAATAGLRITPNEAYSPSQKSIKVPLAMGRSAAAAKEAASAEASAAVREQRRHQMDSVIVNIMKRNEQMDLDALIAAATKALESRFKASASDLRKRIDDLESRDYIEPEGNNVYAYVP